MQVRWSKAGSKGFFEGSRPLTRVRAWYVPPEHVHTDSTTHPARVLDEQKCLVAHVGNRFWKELRTPRRKSEAIYNSFPHFAGH